MSDSNIPEPIKLLARNAPAVRKTQALQAKPRLVAGNPISTRLESGIGNCFPGLECDLRNLERRFFPFLETDIINNVITLVKVDMDGLNAARKQPGAINDVTYRAYLALDASKGWRVKSIKGTFGPLGKLEFDLNKLKDTSTGKGRRPSNAWTAIRLLTEGSDVFLTWDKRGSTDRIEISGKRAPYLNDDGALADMFAPGELTQSLCSPWTHDFRDCACFYWASNHPDIVLPALPSGPTTDARWDAPVAWERSSRTLDGLPAPATGDGPGQAEMQYYEINRHWQKLNFVIEGREQTGPYAQRAFLGTPLPDDKTLETHLRYAAGVELAVLHEYLAAVYSLKSDEELPARHLRDNVRATRAELMRIALGEMRHLRAVNTVIASLVGQQNYKPALGVAQELPGPKSGPPIPVQPSAFTREAQKRFIDIEAPSETAASQTVDGLYAHILATLNTGHPAADVEAIRTIMTEGEDHYRTFLDLRAWLKPHDPSEYLRSINPKRAPADNPLNQKLQSEYLELLRKLYQGYKTGLPFGASDLNQARGIMVSELDAVAKKLASANFLVIFDIPKGDKRFAPVATPPKK